MQQLQNDIRSCTVCQAFLPYPPKPILQAATNSKIAIIGQAPGQRAHDSGIPWDDRSGDELRRWLGVDKSSFYNPENFALVPMGFCYPGKGTSGDLPPRPECATLWHHRLFSQMPDIRLTILIGLYAQTYYLPAAKLSSVTDIVKNSATYLPRFLPLVHPSPRNKIWQKKNPWFMRDIIPVLQENVGRIFQADPHPPKLRLP